MSDPEKVISIFQTEDIEELQRKLDEIREREWKLHNEIRERLTDRDLTAFLYQRERGYCIGMISSRWCAKGANVCGAGGL